MNLWCGVGGGERRRLPGPKASVSHLQSMQGVEGELRAEGVRGKQAALCGQRRASEHVDRWRPWVTEAKHVSKPGGLPVCRQAEGQFFDELEIGSSGGRSAEPLCSALWILRSEVKELVISVTLELVYVLGFLFCLLC